MEKEQLRTLDISTLNTDKKETTDSRKRFANRWTANLHVEQNRQQLEGMVVPRGISLKIHPYSINENQQMEGTLITLYATNQNPNVLCQREKDELDNYISTRLNVINDKPYELSQHEESIKIETKIFNNDIANKAFNIYKMGEHTYGEI
jgi:hypothetical protein